MTLIHVKALLQALGRILRIVMIVHAPLKEQFLENFEKCVHNDKCLNVIVFTAADVDNAMHAVKCNKADGA